MKKFLIILLFTCLIIGGMGLYMVSQKKSHENLPVFVASTATSATVVKETPATSTPESQEKEDVGFFNIALQKQDPKKCESIQNEIKKIECHETLTAMTITQSGTVEMCDTLTLASIGEKCRITIYQNEAIAAKNKSLCVKINDRDIRLHCREVIDEVSLRKILESKSATLENCNTLEKKYRTPCLDSLTEKTDDSAYISAISAENLDTCDKINDPEQKTACRDTVIMKQAIANKAPASCGLLSDASKKGYCLTRIGSKNESELYREYIATNNAEGCTTLTDTGLSSRCHDMIVISRVRQEKDRSLCQTLTDTGMVMNCARMAGDTPTP